jgi:hypothetical protein
LKDQATNLGVRSSNLFGRANQINDLSKIVRKGREGQTHHKLTNETAVLAWGRQRVVDAYFFRDHFDDRETCCPLIALPSDVMRGSDAVKGSYREVLEKLVEIFMDDLDEPQRRERALALAALCVGGIVTPKCVDDPALADDLRRAAHRQALRIGGWTVPTSRRQRKMPQSGRSPNRLAPLMSTPPRLRGKGRGLSAL